MKLVWGTDERCAHDQDETERMLAEAERKVEKLITTLDDRPPKNLDEALYEMSRRGEG